MNIFVGFVARTLTADITIPTQSDPVPVKSVFGWIIFHQRYAFSPSWDANWAEYKAGFGSIDADFWIGLEKLYLLTSSQPYRLRVEMQGYITALWYSAEYWSFKIGDELNDKYRLEVSGYSGDAGDSLQYEGDGGTFNHNGMKFTTYDQDNDNNGTNCASSSGGGWWYNSCFWVCLTCTSVKNSWGTIGDVVNSRMMIKLQ